MKKSRQTRRRISFESLESRHLLAANPIITEFMADNGNSLSDGNGAETDWIEIYNSGDLSVDLSGYSLTDNVLDPNKWVFPSTNLAVGQYLVVFASGDNLPDPAGNLHTNFKLSASGEYLALLDPAGTTVSEYNAGGTNFPAQTSDVSYGLGFNSGSTTVVTPSSSSKYFIPANNSVDSTWTGTSFNDASWASGTAALGYEGSPVGSPNYTSLIQTALPTGTTTAYVRIPFTITDPTAVLSSLQLNYEDGFIAYINGQQVASSNAPASPGYQSTATAENPDGAAIAGQSFDVSAFNSALVVGNNVLAIRMLNTSSGSSDLLAVASLEVSTGTIANTGVTGALVTPTPGLPNSALLANNVAFSREGGAFLGSFSLTLSTPDPTETIRYTTNGTTPTIGSTAYTGPITISTRTQVTARAFGASGQSGNPLSETYTPTDNVTDNFTSDLPIVVIEHFSQGVPGTGDFEDSVFTLHDVDPNTGRAAISNPAEISMNMGLKRRGSSTAGNEKTNYRLELRDEFGEDQSVSLLGMPANSDWILYAPYSFDRAMVRDTFFFEVSNEIGHYSPRTRFVEVYANTNNGTLNQTDYMGTYVLMENIKLGSDRVDLSTLSASDNTGSDVTGGYILKIDRTDGSTDSGWTSNIGNPTADANNFFVHVEPERADMTQAQVDYIRGYVDDFETALYGPNSTDPVLGYAAYFDVGPAIDYHIVKTLSKDPDALRLSTYLVKDKDGKLTFGPQWDFDRSASPDGDGRAANPTGWDANEAPFFDYDWWGELFDDPDFMQQWVDRWQELRSTVLSDAAIAARIDSQAAEIAESSTRNFAQWTNVAPNGGTYADAGLSGWEAEVSHFKNWVIARAQWMDTQMVTALSISPSSGNVANGTQVTLAPNQPGDSVYYTLDGSDPRDEGGGVSPSALLYTTPFTVSSSLTVTARSNGSPSLGGGVTSNSSYPAGENPSDAIDNNTSTKYLNFGEENSGIIIRTGTATVRSFRLTTANDAVERDPASYEIYGTNDAISSTDNSTGTAENWTLISSGGLSLPTARGALAPLVSFANNTAYSSYKLMFPTVKNASSANSMQIAEISFHGNTGGTGVDIIAASDLALAVHAETSNSTANGLSPWSEPVAGVFATAVPADASNLRITEMHFHPTNPTAAELAVLPLAEDDDFEFIELVNTSFSIISLIGVQFTTGITFDFNTSSITTLQPGEKIVLVEDTEAFALRYGTSGIPVGGQYSGNIGNGGEQITLVDASGAVIHDYVYDDVAPWPVAADGDGPSMEVIDVFGNYNDPGNWRATSLNGTPGVIPGDFDNDGQLTCSDINAMNAVAISGSNAAAFDVNSSGAVDAADVAYWVSTLRGTVLGDANLDGTVDSADFAAWNANRFTTTTSYCGGDFNTDGIADVSDLNLWHTARNAQVAAAAASAAATPSNSVALDVNGDGVVSPLDALRIINAVNSDSANLFDSSLDMNEDGLVTAVDALMVINELNVQNATARLQSVNVDAVFEEEGDEGDGGDGEKLAIQDDWIADLG